MRKKAIALSIFILIITAVVIVHFLGTSGSSISERTCPFCDEKVINRQKFYEDHFVIVMCTHQPIVPSHFLMIPKRHVERLELLTHEELTHIHQAIDKVHQASHSVFKTSPYLIHQKMAEKLDKASPTYIFTLLGNVLGTTLQSDF